MGRWYIQTGSGQHERDPSADHDINVMRAWFGAYDQPAYQALIQEIIRRADANKIDDTQ